MNNTKIVLRHIATPFACVLAYLLSYAIIKLSWLLMIGDPMTSIFCSILASCVGMVVSVLNIKNIAPSHYFVHFAILCSIQLTISISSICINGNTTTVSYLDLIGEIIGIIIGFFILRAQRTTL